MRLKIKLEQTGQTWTLQPQREYIIGSGSDCDISVPYVNIVDSRHLKLSFNQFTKTWHVCDLNTTNLTLVDNQRITDRPITAQTRIAIANQVLFVATPEGAASPAQTPKSGAGIRSFEQKVLTWKEYVDKQVKKQPAGSFSAFTTRFYLITGLRNTPWVRTYGQTGFNAFDGYIIPNFNGSAKTVAEGIEEKLTKMTQYEDTNCFVAELTDAHIADSATQGFLGVELFPIRRSMGGKGDYRRFCILSYHRVRTYLLVENYGSDLFVSWVTRFEPDPTPVVPGLWLAIACLLTLLLVSSTSTNRHIISPTVPLTIWFIRYEIVPRCMEDSKILPKKANARLVIFLILILYGIVIYYSLANDSLSLSLSLGMIIMVLYFEVMAAFNNK
ncbi:MAG: FHA domain-containing protein [Microcoleus sp.]